MFSTFSLVAYGIQLRKIRKFNHLTQTTVSAITGIHIDTLRRIENGSVVPKYETLEILSNVYKTDLLLVLNKFKNDQNITDLYILIDKILIRSETDKIDQITQISDTLLAYNQKGLINKNEFSQFVSFIQATKSYHEKTCKKNDEHIDNLSRSLRLTVPQFSIDSYKEHNYSSFELRILLLIGLFYKSGNNFDKSTEILVFCLNQLLEKDPIEDIDSKKIIVKLYYNISYNYYKLKNDTESLNFAELGIDYSMINSSFYCLALLYARKATAQLYLGVDDYKKNYIKAISLLYILDDSEQAEQMRQITLDLHKVKLESLDLSTL